LCFNVVAPPVLDDTDFVKHFLDLIQTQIVRPKVLSLNISEVVSLDPFSGQVLNFSPP
jgi:hypothetical protein